MNRILLAAALCCAAAPALAQAPAAPADTGRVYELAEVDAPPRVTNAAEMRTALQASFPPARLHAGTDGSVTVSFVVAADGSVRQARIVSSSDTAFDAPSLDAVALLRFTPGQVAGSPVATRVDLPVNWQAPEPAPEPAGAPVVSATDRQVNGERVYEMSEVTVEANTYELSAVSEPPRPRNSSAVRRAMERLYPREARGSGGIAIVQVRFRVDAQGNPSHFRITSSSDRRFDEVSIEAAGTMRFHPARVDGRAVAVWVELPLAWSEPSRGMQPAPMPR